MFFFRRWARDAEISRGWISSCSLKQIWRARDVAEIEQGFENGRPVFKHSQGHGSYGRRPTFLDGSLDELETIEARVGANRRLGTKWHTPSRTMRQILLSEAFHPCYGIAARIKVFREFRG